MGCGCGGGTATVTPGDAIAQYSAMRAPSGDAVLVQYTGLKQAEIYFRGRSVTYAFAAGDAPKWVLGADLDLFRQRPDFEVLDGIKPNMDEDDEAAPVLVAPGPPRREVSEAPDTRLDPRHAGATMLDRLGIAPVAHPRDVDEILADNHPLMAEAVEASAPEPEHDRSGRPMDNEVFTEEPPVPHADAITEVDPELAIRALMEMGRSREEAIEIIKTREAGGA